MRRLGISHVLNCAGYKGPRPSPNASPYDGLGIEYYEFKAEDSDRYDITRHFTEAFRFLDAAKRVGGIALVHCALGINRSAAVCVAYMMVDRRQPLLTVTRLIKDRRRIVLANKAFQRQLVAFARSRGLLGDLPHRDDDDDDDRLSRTVRRVLSLHDRPPDGIDWRMNGLSVDAGHRRGQQDTYTRSREEWASAEEDWRSYSARMGDNIVRALKPRDGGPRSAVQSTSARYDHQSEFTPQRRMLPLTSRAVATRSREFAARSREIDDVTPSWVSPPSTGPRSPPQASFLYQTSVVVVVLATVQVGHLLPL